MGKARKKIKKMLHHHNFQPVTFSGVLFCTYSYRSDGETSQGKKKENYKCSRDHYLHGATNIETLAPGPKDKNMKHDLLPIFGNWINTHTLAITFFFFHSVK